MADKTGYIGRNPSDSSVVIARQTFEPSGSTTTFTFAAGYTVGYLDLYLNGSRLIEGRDYNANNGTTAVLVSAVTSGDVVEIIAYKAFNVGDAASSSVGNFSVGNDLSVTNDAAVSQNLNVTGVTTTGLGLNVSAGGANISGVVTATSYQGDGSALTGIAATDTIAAASLTVSGITTLSNELKVTAGGIEVDGGGLDIAGVSTFAGVVSAGSDVRITGNINAGISTFGVVTVTSITGDGSGLTGVANTDFISNVNIVSTATTTSRLVVGSGVTVAGIATASSFDGAISEWTLGADGTSNYTFTGPGFTGAENDPKVYLKRGQRYNFKNATGAHPFKIQSTPYGSSPASSGTAYNDGVTNNDAASGTTLIFDVQHDAPNRLYYQCTSHTAMGGEIIIDNGFATQEANGFEVTHAGTASTSRFLAGGSVGVGIGVTTTTGRDAAAGVGTVKGQIVYNETAGRMQVYGGTEWIGIASVSPLTTTGGTKITNGSDVYHVYNKDAGATTFVVEGTAGLTGAKVLIVGGGAGSNNDNGAAGGAGGVVYGSNVPFSPGTYPARVGVGGSANGSRNNDTECNGQPSRLSTPVGVVTGFGGQGSSNQAGNPYGLYKTWGNDWIMNPYGDNPDITPNTLFGSGCAGRITNPTSEEQPNISFPTPYGQPARPTFGGAFTNYGNNGGGATNSAYWNTGGGGGAGEQGTASNPGASPRAEGGDGQPFPEFPAPIIAPGIPSPFRPGFISEVGPTGIFGGGGGGSMENPAFYGTGGAGGGGDASSNPSTTTGADETKGQYGTGGGAGSPGAGSPESGARADIGGAGIIIIKYTV